MSKKQSSVEWFLNEFSKQIEFVPESELDKWYKDLIPKAKAMHKEEIKMIIEHYHNSLFYLELREIELENITKIIYKELFGGQDNE
jgi:hypothetical protein